MPQKYKHLDELKTQWNVVLGRAALTLSLCEKDVSWKYFQKLDEYDQLRSHVAHMQKAMLDPRVQSFMSDVRPARNQLGPLVMAETYEQLTNSFGDNAKICEDLTSMIQRMHKSRVTL